MPPTTDAARAADEVGRHEVQPPSDKFTELDGFRVVIYIWFHIKESGIVHNLPPNHHEIPRRLHKSRRVRDIQHQHSIRVPFWRGRARPTGPINWDRARTLSCGDSLCESVALQLPRPH